MNTNRPRVWITSLIGAVMPCVACVISGCSTYDHSYAFDPAIADQRVEFEGTEPRQTIHTLTSVTGVRRADAETGDRACLEVRFRIENRSDADVAIDAASISVVSADLLELGEPIIVEGSTVAPPDDATMLVAWLPLPEGASPSSVDLSGLNASWSLLVDGKPIHQNAAYTRRRPLHRYYLSDGFGFGCPPWFGYGYGYGYGYASCHY